ncbi:MAG: biopolymer transporter ExbD [Burkholderiaceae bacterium]|nr:biopolymer transporter ExbD [Burkholderiaceae bacterium]
MNEWRNRRSRRFKSEINVVPYIDVMLVLLIIFMVAAPLISPSIINLPTVGMQANNPAPSAIEIVMRSEGGVLELIDTASKKSLGSLPQPQAIQTIKSQQENLERPVVISADKNVRYEAVVKLLADLNREGVKRVGLSVVKSP